MTEIKGLKEIMEEAIANSFWATRPVEDEPEISLVRWQIMEVGDKRHFVGYNSDWMEGRVSSAIVTFDEKSKRGVTESGRVYQLVGETGMDRDAHYVLEEWLYRNGFKRDDVHWRIV